MIGRLILLSLFFLTTACGVETPAPTGEATQSLAADAGRPGFFTVRRDFRRCISPLCGGWWVKSVNRARTRCTDGTRQDECYVAEIAWADLGLSPAQLDGLHQAPGIVLHGRLMPRDYGDFGNLGAFSPRHTWAAATDQGPTGRHWRVEDLGIVCITEPCFNLRAHLVGRARVRQLSELDLTAVRATDAQLEAARAALGDGTLLAVGHVRRTARNPHTGRRGRTLLASQFYLPVEPLECVVDADCTVTAYHSPVASAEACYCATCAETPMGITEAELNESSWQAVCADVLLMCPARPCHMPPPVACERNTCVLAEECPTPDHSIVCPLHYAPFDCGGCTYGNLCFAQAAGFGADECVSLVGAEN